MSYLSQNPTAAKEYGLLRQCAHWLAMTPVFGDGPSSRPTREKLKNTIIFLKNGRDYLDSAGKE
jgi:hypothetical protein